MATIWKKAVEAVEVGEDTGDILAPLKRVYETYLKHRDRILNKALQQGRNLTDKEVAGVEYYQASAESVRELITQ